MKKLGFGLMRLPLLDKDDYSSIDIERFKNMADTFLANGFTYFDTAYPYHRGNSEVAFREAVVKRYPRSAYTITDKLSLFMIHDEKEIPGFFEKQLQQLGVDYVDYYWLHGLNGRTYQQAEEMHAFEFIQAKKAEGKIRHIGLSFHDKAALLDEILTAHPELEYVQIQLNYLDWNDPAVESRLCYEVVVKHNKPVIVMEPVKGGSLIQIPETATQLFKETHPELSTASWAIRFAASPSHVMMVLSGMSDEPQVEDNVMMGMFRKAAHTQQTSKIRTWSLRVIAVLLAICGIHAFVKNRISSYLFLRTQFVFIDFSQPVVLALLDYLAIIAFFAVIVYYISKLIKMQVKMQKK